MCDVSKRRESLQNVEKEAVISITTQSILCKDPNTVYFCQQRLIDLVPHQTVINLIVFDIIYN